MLSVTNPNMFDVKGFYKNISHYLDGKGEKRLAELKMRSHWTGHNKPWGKKEKKLFDLKDIAFFGQSIGLFGIVNLLGAPYFYFLYNFYKRTIKNVFLTARSRHPWRWLLQMFMWSSRSSKSTPQIFNPSVFPAWCLYCGDYWNNYGLLPSAKLGRKSWTGHLQVQSSVRGSANRRLRLYCVRRSRREAVGILALVGI